jgi:hypothetical protein
MVDARWFFSSVSETSLGFTGDAVPDILVPDPLMQREFGVTAMTINRWDHNENLGFPPKIKLNGRNYRSRRALEAFKARLMAQALKAR